MPKKNELLHDLTSKTFGWLTVICRGENLGYLMRWLCLCQCGRTTQTSTMDLIKQKAQSCGCSRRSINKKHGDSQGRPEYEIWKSMRKRCRNPRDPAYKNYGGRGITVCTRWDTYENFIADMGARPDPSLTLERKNNDGNYEPSNCVWATRTEQSKNRRPRCTRSTTHQLSALNHT